MVGVYSCRARSRATRQEILKVGSTTLSVWVNHGTLRAVLVDKPYVAIYGVWNYRDPYHSTCSLSPVSVDLN